MLKLEDMTNEIYFMYRRSQMDALKTERLGQIHVSDVIKPCMRNVIYGKVLPKTGMNTEDTKSLYFGQVVHNNSEIAKGDNHEKFLAYDYVRDEPLTREEALKIPDDDPRQLDIIYGSIDYFSRATSKVSDSHRDQINRYRVLLKKCYNIDAEFGSVVYISNKIEKDKRDKPIVISFKLRPIEETLTDMINKANIVKTALSEKILPERTKCFLCDGMCPYASLCFEDNRAKWDEEL